MNFYMINEANMKLYRERNHYSSIGLALGILAVFLWLIPLLGILVSIACLYFVYMGLKSKQRTIAYFGMVLGIIGLVLTVIRSALGYFMV